MTYERYLRSHLKAADMIGDELACFCPLHADKGKPSFSINIKTGKWKCFVSSCPGYKGGSIIKLAKQKGWPAPVKATPDFAALADPRSLLVPESEIKAAIKLLWGKKGNEARAYLKKRGINAATMHKFELGMGKEDGRVWIPVKGPKGYSNVRRYDWAHLDKAKFLHYGEGYGTNVLWPSGVVERHEEIILFEGELDCMLAHALGIENAVTTTGGAGAWEDVFSRALTGKTVFVVYDIDDPGIQGSLLVSRNLALTAGRCHIVRLPISEPANGDFSDYMAAVGFSRKSFLDLIGSSRGQDQAATKTLFTKLPQTGTINRWLGLRAIVSGKDTSPFNVPSQVSVACVPGASPACSQCPLRSFRGSASCPIPITSKPVLKAVMSTDLTLEVELDKFLGIPARCPGHTTEITATVPLWDVRLSPDVDSGEEEGEAGARRAFSMKELGTNQPYDLEVMAVSDPKTQYALLHILDAKSSQTGLDTWTTEGKEALLKLWEPENDADTLLDTKRSMGRPLHTAHGRKRK